VRTETTRCEYRVGTASWTDPTLLAASYYPSTARSAEARLRYYAGHFNTVEVDSTYYALPSERNAALWAERTPADFRFCIKAFAWLTGHAAETRALPRTIRALLPQSALQQPRLQPPATAVLNLSFEMFRTALAPLHDAGKLGCILLQFPPWFTARSSNEAYIDICRQELSEYHLAVEFRHRSWVEDRLSRTCTFLAERNLSLVCMDAPVAASIPHLPYVTTCDVAYLRFHGRNRQAWFQRQQSAAQRFKYLYSDAELRQCAAAIRRLRGAHTTYVIFNNCYADYGVRNAQSMRQLLEEGS
jgi:uncharacterized protein YecE (DUF72 family)